MMKSKPNAQRTSRYIYGEQYNIFGHTPPPEKRRLKALPERKEVRNRNRKERCSEQG